MKVINALAGLGEKLILRCIRRAFFAVVHRTPP
jgi:hypothetical protein